LLADGHEVVGYDNFSTGREMFLESARVSSAFTLHTADLLDQASLTSAMSGCELVFHLAANADVRFGPDRPR
jgi:UDP-glucose 4-epimerase